MIISYRGNNFEPPLDFPTCLLQATFPAEPTGTVVKSPALDFERGHRAIMKHFFENRVTWSGDLFKVISAYRVSTIGALRCYADAQTGGIFREGLCGKKQAATW